MRLCASLRRARRSLYPPKAANHSARPRFYLRQSSLWLPQKRSVSGRRLRSPAVVGREAKVKSEVEEVLGIRKEIWVEGNGRKCT